MIEDQDSSSQNQGTILQGTGPDRQISTTPKKRKTGIAFRIVYVLIDTGIIAYACIKNKEIDLCTPMPQNQAETETCDIREKNRNYLVFIRFSLGLLGILLAPTVRCLCDFVEELCRQPGSRDRRSIFKLFKPRFSGVPWKSIAVVFLIDTIACVLAKKSFNFGDLMYILGGIDLYPLVAYLLNLNEQSEIGLSRLLENLLEKLLVTCFHFFLILIALSDLINDIYNIRPDESDRPKNMSFLSVRSKETGSKETNNLEMGVCGPPLAKTVPAWSEMEYKRPSDEERAFFGGHDNSVERLPRSIFPIKENKEAFDRHYVPNDHQTFLIKRLEWVESFKIVDANKECNKRHLEIVCKFAKVPRTADIVNIFGEGILPFITYQECSKTEWFETNIFDENFEMIEEYKDQLSSLSWVKDFYIGFDSEQEKSWQIYITYAQNSAPSMVDLKEIFGVNIASFVDFIQESVNVVSKGDEKSLPSSGFLRGPRSGDKLCIRNEALRCGTIGILAVRVFPDEKHYAITCYHVCYNDILPESLFLGHRDLMTDYERNAERCVGVEFEDEVRGQLGKFSRGLYNERHDIALVALKGHLNCDDAVAFLEENGIETTLASKNEVGKRFRDMEGKVPVEKFGSVTEGRRGQLFGVDSKPLENGMNSGFYRIRGTGGEVFAERGDSGSLVYMICKDGKKIPFAYFSNIHENVYNCPNLRHSLDALCRSNNSNSSSSSSNNSSSSNSSSSNSSSRRFIKPCLRVCGFE